MFATFDTYAFHVRKWPKTKMSEIDCEFNWSLQYMPEISLLGVS